jgi:glucose-6-phosphate isomerase, archaeal
MKKSEQRAHSKIERIMKVDWTTALMLPHSQIRESVKTLGQLENIFLNEQARRAMNPEEVVYRVQAWCPVLEGTEGAQFWGNTVIEPGRVDTEYFMTHGHFHQKRNRTEYYGVTDGEGVLILMDESRKTCMEVMSAGSLHFIPPNTAHRVANTGTSPLRFVACWPADAGHDYAFIREHGFGARLLNVNGKPSFVRSEG